MSDSPSTPERLSALETKTDRILEEISTLRSSFVELEKYFGNHATQIERMRVELNFVKVIGTWIFAPLLGTIDMGALIAVFYALRK